MIQCQVLNHILQYNDLDFIISNNLSIEFFSDYAKEYQFIKNHIDSYNKLPDFTTFLGQFSSFDVIEVKEPTSYLLAKLYEDLHKRQLVETFNKIRDLITKDKVADALKLFTTASQDVSTNIGLKTVDIIRDTSRYDAYIERTEDFKKYYISTGFAELDAIIGGWDKHEELATIVARSGVGKTWALLKVASSAAKQGLTVGIYSGEMSAKKVGYRLDTLLGHISNRKLIHGDIEVANEYKRYLDSLPQEVPGKVHVLTPDMIGGPATVTSLRAFIEKDHLDILCIDQHSLLEDDRKARTPVEKASNISKDLKNLQVLKQIPFIAVSQQNRSSTEGGVDLTHISQADRIGQDSTLVLFLEEKEKVLTMTVVKARDSEHGQKLQYLVDLDKGEYKYLPTEVDALSGADCDKLKEEYDYDAPVNEDIF